LKEFRKQAAHHEKEMGGSVLFEMLQQRCGLFGHFHHRHMARSG